MGTCRGLGAFTPFGCPGPAVPELITECLPGFEYLMPEALTVVPTHWLLPVSYP